MALRGLPFEPELALKGEGRAEECVKLIGG